MKTTLLFLALSLSLPAIAAQPQQQAPAKQHASSHSQDPGERAFQANCSRCHSAPEQLSPNITGTVVTHMRVRANLSAKDAELIKKYLAP